MGRHPQHKAEKAEMGIVRAALFGLERRTGRWETLRKSYWVDWKRGREGNQHFLEAKIVKTGLGHYACAGAWVSAWSHFFGLGFPRPLGVRDWGIFWKS